MNQLRLSCLFALLTFHLTAHAYERNTQWPANQVPAEFQDIGITEHLGNKIDLSTEVVGDDGKIGPLSQYFSKDKPVLFTIVYYECPNLCNLHLNGLTDVLKRLQWTVGREFELVALSMNDKEGPGVAAPKKRAYLKEYGRPESQVGWHFLTAKAENIHRLAEDVGFKFKWVEDQKQFSHASAAVILTPDGHISRYLYGVEFEPQTVRMSLLEASKGTIGTVVDQLILFCFQFDPSKNKYTLYAYNLMRLGGAIAVLLLGFLMIPMWLRERRRGTTA